MHPCFSEICVAKIASCLGIANWIIAFSFFVVAFWSLYLLYVGLHILELRLFKKKILIYRYAD